MRFIRELLQKLAVRQFIKYVIVGCIVTAIDMLVLHLLFKVLGLPIKVAVVSGFMCGNVSSFIFNKYFTFRNFSAEIFRQYAKYFFTSMTGLLWTILLMTLFYEKLGLFAGVSNYNYLLCKMIVAVLVMFWNFTIIRHWTLASYEFTRVPALSEYGKENKVFLSVVIPAYNEEKRIPATITAVQDWLGKQEFTSELIIVDDGSTDRMVKEISKQFGSRPGISMYSLNQNQGKGAAVRTGMLMANGEYRLFMDADHQIRIEELDGFLPEINSKRVIIGSKYAGKTNWQDLNISPVRKLVSRLGNFIIRSILNLNVHDTQCGFKLFPAEVAEAVFRLQKLKGFAFDVEVLCLVKLFRVDIVEKGIKLQLSDETRVRTWHDSISVFADLLRIKMNIWRRLYHGDKLPAAESLNNHQVL